MGDAKRTSLLKKAATLALGAASIDALLCAAAAAQSVPPPPVRSAIDENGVNLLNGAIDIASPTISIGQPGLGGLAYGRYWDGSVSAWRDNMAGGIDLNATSGLYVVTLGGASVQFSRNVNVFTEVEARGAKLVYDTGTDLYTFTAADGTVAIYDGALASTLPIEADTARVISATDPSGETTTFTYTTLQAMNFLAHRLQSVRNNFGYQLKFEYQTNNPDGTGIILVKVTAINNGIDYCDPAANTCTGLTVAWPTLTFAVNGTVQTTTDPLGRETRYTVSAGSLTAVRRPTSTTDNVTIAYSSGRVSSVSNGTGTWTYTYSDAAGIRTTTVTDPSSHQRVVTSDIATGTVASDKDGLNRTTTYLYDSSNRLQRVTQPEGNAAEFAYDGRGNLTQTTLIAKSGSGLSNIVSSAAYPSSCTNPVICNKPTSITDARGFRTDFTYDSAHGGLLVVTSPAPTGSAPVGSGVRPETRFAYSSLSAWFKQSSGGGITQATSVVRPASVSACATTSSCAGGADETKTTLTYTAGSSSVASNLLPASTSSGAGNGSLTATTAVTFDNIGNRLTVDGPLSGTADTTRTRYDEGRQVVGVVGPDPDGAASLKHRALKFSYNLDGQPTAVEQGTVNGQSDADWANFVSLQQRAMVYDSIGRMTRQSLTAGATTFAVSQFTYDAENRLECAAVRMNPSVFGSLPSSACALGTAGSFGADRIAKFLYSAADEVTTVRTAVDTAAQQETAVATSTNNGLQATLTDAGGNTTTFEYDGFDRLAKMRFPSPTTPGTSSTTDYEQYTYDAGSNVTADRRRDGASIAFSYDNLSRRTSMDLPGGSAGDVAYAFDNFGRMLSAAIAGHTLSFGYDQLSRVTSQTNPRGTLGYTFDLAGRRTRITHPDSFYADYDFNLTDEVTAIRVNGAASGIGVVANYAYDDLGRRTALTRGNGVVTSYGYNGASWLTSLAHDLAGAGDDQSYGFTLNPAGQIVARTSSNSAYAHPTPGTGTTGYSDNGLNQYTAVGAATPTYDARGNITYDGTRSYGYDALNRLVSAGSGTLAWDPVDRLATFNNGSGNQGTLWDGGDLVTDYTTAGAVNRRFVHGPGLDEPLVWYDGADTSAPFWALQDQLGSVVAWSTGAGAKYLINTFDEYGKPGANNGARFQFTGQTWMPGTIGSDLYHYKARIYSTTLGRFLQTDPIGYDGGLNLYTYVGNDPVNFLDPWGLEQACPEVLNCKDEIVVAPAPRLFWGFIYNLFGGGGRGSASHPGDPGGGAADDEIVVTAQRRQQKSKQCGVVNLGINAAGSFGFGPAGGGGVYLDRDTGNIGTYSAVGLATGEGVEVQFGGGWSPSFAAFSGVSATFAVAAGGGLYGGASISEPTAAKPVPEVGYQGGFVAGLGFVGTAEVTQPRRPFARIAPARCERHP